MPPKIFITGSTGYIGGSVLHTLATAHPDWNITVLLRRVPPNFTSVYPDVSILHGDYDATAVLSNAAEAADIVVHCGDSDHEGSLNAILTGLGRKQPGTGYLIHLSGTGIVSDWISPAYLGQQNPKVWSDTSPADMQELRSLPDSALHRNTEKILHAAVREQPGHVNIAIVCPPDIYGRGKGLIKTQSALVPYFIAGARKLGRVFYVDRGTNTRSWVHIDDLMRVYLHIVEAAASKDHGARDRYFGQNGYYFAGTQEHLHIDVARVVGELLAKHGILEHGEPVQVGLEELDKMANIPKFPKLARYLFASNSRTRADRARELWGYQGQAPGLLECLGNDVEEAVKVSRK